MKPDKYIQNLELKEQISALKIENNAFKTFLKMNMKYLHCAKCKIDFKKVDKYTYEPACKCCKTKLRMCMG